MVKTNRGYNKPWLKRNHGLNKPWLQQTIFACHQEFVKWAYEKRGGGGGQGGPFITVIIEYGYSLIRKCGTELIYEGQKNLNRKTVPKDKLKLASKKMYFQVK
jgi:hypothetical protein